MSGPRRRRALAAILGGLAAVALALGVLLFRPTADHPGPARRGGGAAARPAGGAATTRSPARPLFAQPGVAGRRVAGAVTYGGRPVAGASVFLETLATRAGAAETPDGATDGAGRFDLGVQPAEVVDIVASQPGRRSAALRIDLRDPTLAPPPDELSLELGPCEASISGIVEDNSGGPIARAAVTVARTRVVTDEQGAFAACVAPGPVSILAQAPGYGRRAVTTSAPRRQPVRIGLAPEAILRGRTVRAEDGTPVEGAIVGVLSETVDAETVSGADGGYVLDGLTPGAYRLRAYGEGRRYRRRRDDRVTLFAGIDAGEVVLPLDATATVRGRVVAAGRPVAGAEVGLSPEDGAYMELAELGRSVTQRDGSFAFAGLPPGGCKLDVEGWRIVGPVQRVITLDPPEMVVEVAALARIRGRVLRDGKPAGGARVLALGAGGGGGYQAVATSGSDGSYELRGLTAGSHDVTAESAALGAFAAPRSITVADGELREGVDLALDLAGSIAGVVVDAAGRPDEGLLVTFNLSGGRDFGQAVTALDGSFTARGLSGGGDYQVAIHRAGQDRLLSPASGGDFPAVRVADGNSHADGVRFVVRDDRLPISGRVEREGGAPLADVRVDAVVPGRRELWDPGTASALTRADGAFELTDLPVGRYVVRARAPGDAPPHLVRDVEAGTKALVVTLPAAGGVEGTLVGFATPPGVTAERADGTMIRGRVTGQAFALPDLAPGTYAVSAASDEEGDTAVVEVAARETAHVTLTSRGVAHVDGRAVDVRTGAPVAGMRCVWQREAGAAGGRRFKAPGRTPARVDRDGRFALAVPAAVAVTITCYPRDWGREAVSAAEINLAAGARAAVRVLVVTAQRDGRERAVLDARLADAAPAAVLEIVPGGRAARAGLAAGDLVMSVDGVAVDELGGQAVRLLATDRPAADPIALTVRRGAAMIEVRVEP